MAVGAHHGPIPVDDAGLPVARDVVTGRAVLDRAPVHVHDLTEAGVDFATGRAMAHRFGFRTILAIPLLRDGEAVGALMIRRIEMRPFTDKQIALLKTFADQAVIAISNVRLFEEVQARTRDLQESLEYQTATSDVLGVISRSPAQAQPVLDTIVTTAGHLCEADYAYVYMRKDDGKYHLVAAHPADAAQIDYWRANPVSLDRGTTTGRTALERRTVHIPDATADPAYTRSEWIKLSDARTFLGVPLLRDGDPIGVIAAARRRTVPFSDRQIELITTFADQAVIAIENARLFEEVQARTAELTEALAQQTATADVLKVISASTFDLKAVLQTLIESAVKLCGAELGGIYMLDGDVYRISASHGDSPELRAHEEAHPNRVGRDSWVGRAALERVVVHVPDVTLDLEYGTPDVPKIGKFAAGLSVPLLREGIPIGVFSMARAKPGPFSERQIELVQTFADQAVIAIENVRLFEEVQQRTREATEALEYQTATSDVLGVISRSPTDVQPVFNMIAQSAARLCEAQFCFVYRYDGQLLHFVAHHGITEESVEIVRNTFPVAPTRGSAAERAILYLEVAQIPDLTLDSEFTHRAAAAFSGLRSVVAVPVLRDGLPIGCIAVGRAETGFLAAKQVELLKTFADQAVIAIENVRLFDEVQARTAELSESLQQQTATADVLKVISASAFDLQTVLDTLVESAVRLCRADKGCLERIIDGRFEYAAITGFPPGFREYGETHQTEPGRGSAVGRAAEELRVIQIEDVTVDPEYTHSAIAAVGGMSTVLAVPLLREGELLGTFAMIRTEVRPFNEREIELVKTFADQAVIAIQNVRLFDEVQARTADVSEALRQQTATADVLKVISRAAFDLPTVLNALVESAAKLCGASYGGIFLRYGNMLRGRATISERKTDWMMDHPIAIDRRWLSGRVALSGSIEYIPDVEEDADFNLQEFRAITDTRALMGVPMLREGKVEGVFFLGKMEPNSFTSRQGELVQTFADQAVIAIENVRLFDEVQARTEELSRSLDDLRKAQDRLVQTEKLASLGQLTAGIAHEIKNPLNFVNNFSSLSGELLTELRAALQGAALDDKTRAEIDELSDMLKGNLDKVVQHGKRADSIVRNMLLHSRSGSGEHRPVDINAVVEESLNLAYHGARAEGKGFNIMLERNFDPGAGEVDLFPQEITRVLLNLISNGFYATTKRRAAEGETGYEPVLVASTKSLGDAVEIRIRDNGTGIPPEVKEKMFNPFFTTKPAGEGTGLGLSLSHDIVVKQHAGTIEVDTEPGAFTEFRIVLPRGAATLAKAGGNA
ncbi:GAF domain-containing protein [Mesorhizobium sp.]|uniref:GAF domain-containing protein n=1 Tax=Mesorhizobium sp. TaxID=1871066 RepID=UPI000FE741BB|nr:GAF domain-containing protein [Mesorhizobium sp.]RWP74423.1 MAG: GAF domain-containing protein [Mesorhizobium sp.]